ncbi:CinA family nicotinamide mononucleotide deamidase-related protein [Dinghuibacter silviterrae]|uniref:CinA-like protein n=1 Tax=Dinghuibacter silviterrae TaxID=1539049 RepID=A0A4R8DGV4_9BACT|nr:CinA family nicotinamide mononucleotide deamidase-related protein [Dinghuibacter silviterrae]TDW96474.1 nicotinamide-nucleotide amidase [Dinghuibacter silviterrae]
MEKVLASIITIGDELLIGQTVDTNSAWIAQRLNAMGIWVHRRVAVGDQRDAIWKALDDECALSSIVLVTGGLGPTADDITKPLLAEYFGGKLVVDERVLAHVQYLFEKVFRRPGPMLERNLKQAEVPDVCTVLFNRIGTAPGMWFERNGTVVVSMPGVPAEMKGLMTDEVLPRLQQHFKTPIIAHRTVFTIGMGESMIAERLTGFEAGLPDTVKLAYLPHFGTVRLRLTATGEGQDIDGLFATLCALVKDITVVAEDISLEAYIGRLLLEKGKTLATAESCTGGMLAEMLTSIPGSSRYFLGSVVSYSTSVKETLLGVDASGGVYNEATVTQMVKGVLEQIPADYAIATSGIVGPDGGSEETPVGTVWVAVGTKTRISAKVFHFRWDRGINTQLAAMNALNNLRLFVLEN